MLEEDLTNGESVQQFKITITTAKTQRPTTIYEGINIGHKAIIRVPAIRVKGITLEITKSDGKPVIRELSLYHVGEQL